MHFMCPPVSDKMQYILCKLQPCTFPIGLLSASHTACFIFSTLLYIFITHNVVYALLRKLAIKPRFADTIFCLLRLKLVLQKQDNTARLYSPREQPDDHSSRSRSPTQEVDIRGASEQLERFFRIVKSKKRSQTKFSLRPTFPSHGLQGRHEWPLKCCSCGENNWAEVSCI